MCAKGAPAPPATGRGMGRGRGAGLRRAARWALIGFTAVTVAAYFALAQGHVDDLGVADELVEGLLIALLLVEDRRAR